MSSGCSEPSSASNTDELRDVIDDALGSAERVLQAGSAARFGVLESIGSWGSQLFSAVQANERRLEDTHSQLQDKLSAGVSIWCVCE